MWLQYFPIYVMLPTVSKSFRHSFHPYYFLFMFSSMFLQHYVNIFVGYFATSMLKDLLDKQKKKKEYFKYLFSIFSLKFTYFACVYRCQIYTFEVFITISKIFLIFAWMTLKIDYTHDKCGLKMITSLIKYLSFYVFFHAYAIVWLCSII